MPHIRLKLKQNKLSITWDIMSLNKYKNLHNPCKIKGYGDFLFAIEYNLSTNFYFF